MNIFELVGMIVIENGDANQAINETNSRARDLAASMKKGITDAAKWGAGIATAAAAAALAIGNSIKNIVDETAEYTKTVNNMAQNMGLSTQAYQEWEYIMGLCGLTMEDLQGGMATMLDRMREVDEGSETAIELFGKLGLSVFDVNGEMKDAETMFNEVVIALAGMENETERTQTAMELLSSAGERMAPVFNAGADGIEDMKDRAHELGLVMSGDAVDAGVEYSEAIYGVNSAFTALKNELAVMVMPALTEFSDAMLEKMPAIREKLEELEEPIENTVGALAEGLINIIENPEEIKEKLQKIGAAFMLFGAAVSPAKTMVVALAAAIGKLLLQNADGKTETDKFTESLQGINATLQETIRTEEEKAIKGHTLLDVIEDLSTKTEKTREEQEKWNAAVKQLTEEYPGFIDYIDSENQSIKGGTTALHERIEAYKDLSIAKAMETALQEKYNAVAKAYESSAELQLDVAVKKAQMDEKERAWAEASQRHTDYYNQQGFSGMLNPSVSKEYARLEEEMVKAGEAYYEAEKEYEKVKTDLDKLEPTIKKAEEELQAAERIVKEGLAAAEEAVEAAEAVAETIETAAPEVVPELIATAEKKIQEGLNAMGLTVPVTPVISGTPYTYRSDSRARNALAIPEMHSHADGLDYVPYDDYPARLHKGETVLTAKEASAYRSGEGNARVEAAVNRLGEILNQVLSAIKEGQEIRLETGALVGQTAGAMNDRLGALAVRAGRRN